MSLEIKRKHLELGRVTQAKAEMEFKIDEYLAEIERIKSNIKIQNETIERLKTEINKDVT